jgi:hypothetical protein
MPRVRDQFLLSAEVQQARRWGRRALKTRPASALGGGRADIHEVTRNGGDGGPLGCRRCGRLCRTLRRLAGSMVRGVIPAPCNIIGRLRRAAVQQEL